MLGQKFILSLFLGWVISIGSLSCYGADSTSQKLEQENQSVQQIKNEEILQSLYDSVMKFGEGVHVNQEEINLINQRFKELFVELNITPESISRYGLQKTCLYLLTSSKLLSILEMNINNGERFERNIFLISPTFVSRYGNKNDPFSLRPEKQKDILLLSYQNIQNKKIDLTLYSLFYEFTKQADKILQSGQDYNFKNAEERKVFLKNTQFMREKLEWAYTLTGAKRKEEAFKNESAAAQEIKAVLSEFNRVSQESIHLATTEISSKPIDDDGLVQYLSCEEIPSEVKAFAERGLKKNIRRGEDWILHTFGETEDSIVDKLKKISPPKTWTIHKISEVYEGLVKKNPRNPHSFSKMFLVGGVGINDLHRYPRGGGVVQLASQANFLESPDTEKRKVSQYVWDKTQGPQGSIEAAAAALHRVAAEAGGTLPHALTDVLPKGPMSSYYYQNGYFEPHKLKDETLKDLHTYMKAMIGNLKILAQWVQCESSGRTQLQVFSFAPSYQGRDVYLPTGYGIEICDLLVSAQYEALAKIAVIYNLSTKKPLPVNLTLVGQGAFKNPESVMKTSFQKVADVVKGYDDIKVYIHGYKPDDRQIVRSVSNGASFQLQEMAAHEFSLGQ